MVIRNFDLDKTYQYLLILLAFFIPLTVFGANLIIVIICLLWLFSGKYKTKFKEIISNKLLISSIIFFFLHVIGLLWTEDLSWGLHIVHKMWYFILLLPVFFSIVRKDFIKFYIAGFLAAIAVTEVVSYLVWFEIIDPFKNATVRNPTPFMSHISYNPILAFAIYLVLHEIFFNKKISNLLFSMYGFFALSMSVNMFITGGRAGQVVFFVMLTILIFQVSEKQRIKSLVAVFVVIPGIFISAYYSSDLFRARVDMGVNEILNYSDTSEKSLGLRINYTINSFDVIKENLYIGVGTGDFPIEYRKINQFNSPEIGATTNPHNMYTLILMQLGLVGLFSMLSIFYYQIKFSYNSSKKFIRDVGITLPIMFLVMMLSDSYLLGHYTSLMFIFFSSFLYKDFEKN
jgi:O-antigen ligase